MTERETEGSGAKRAITEPGDDALEALFAAARAECPETPTLSDDFAARLMADARAAQPAGPRGGQVLAIGPRAPFAGLRDMLRAAGFGWPSATGLAAAALAGLWIGYAPPAPLEGVTALVLGEVGLSRAFGTAAPDDLIVAFDLGGLDG